MFCVLRHTINQDIDIFKIHIFKSQYKTSKTNNKCKTSVYKLLGVEHIKHDTTIKTKVHIKHNYKKLVIIFKAVDIKQNLNV